MVKTIVEWYDMSKRNVAFGAKLECKCLGSQRVNCVRLCKKSFWTLTILKGFKQFSVLEMVHLCGTFPYLLEKSLQILFPWKYTMENH